MNHIYTFGETVYDIIFENNQPVKAVPGGAMLNTAVSLGRMKLPVCLITEYGKDRVGDIIDEFLESNNVNTRYINRYKDGKSALAMAFLDEKKNAHYTFYKAYPGRRLTHTLPEVNEFDILLFGSFYSLQEEIREPLMNFVQYAKERGALIIYDPNIRSPHQDKIVELQAMISENISMADIVRASDEDLMTIFGTKVAQEAYRKIRERGCQFLIYTSSDKDVSLFSGQHKFIQQVPEIDPISTIGAGDNFNAGIIYALYNKSIKRKDLPGLDEHQWLKITSLGIAFASDVCMSMENYISKEFVDSINHIWK